MSRWSSMTDSLIMTKRSVFLVDLSRFPTCERCVNARSVSRNKYLRSLAIFVLSRGNHWH